MRIDKKVKQASHQEPDFSTRKPTNQNLSSFKKPFETFLKENKDNQDSQTSQSTLKKKSRSYYHLDDISSKPISYEIAVALNKLVSNKSDRKQMGLSRSINMSASTLSMRCENMPNIDGVRPRQSKLMAIHSIIKTKRLSLNVHTHNQDDDAENQPYLNRSINKSLDLMRIVAFERSNSTVHNNFHQKRRRSLNIHNTRQLLIDESSNNSTGSTFSDISSLNAQTLDFSNINCNIKQEQITSPNNKTSEAKEACKKLKSQQPPQQQITLENKSNIERSSCQENQVVVPKWRKIKPLSKTYRLEGCENMTNEIYLKRHQKFENEEIKIKKWDMRRQREELERNKLLRKEKSFPSNLDMKHDSDNVLFQTSQLSQLSIKFKCPDETELDDIETIQIVDDYELVNIEKVSVQHNQQILTHQENKPNKNDRKKSTKNANKIVIDDLMENSSILTLENDSERTDKDMKSKTQLNSTMPVKTRSKRKNIQPNQQSKRRRTSK